ncbi:MULTISPECIES: cytochrome P450 [Micromonospora]|uniref:Cytochrome P450 n=1 Tax=Micromonospora solifontis TaxID=2487138 RepID=A0ABX9WFH3_9ACTN|nr:MULTISPECIES: cytochrome P450 [Micromonospora]NES15092.1 cytochrome P450 [Micromonospora sp. PPF5-17B]NES37192.1 cytochrome P450 [Micromonospora solifontis]NES56233.1 cytochrome P450 [Micromonospora sp. PPF5-6]RNL98639.1 cytochrome P450 [Micromonospora solifontis]
MTEDAVPGRELYSDEFAADPYPTFARLRTDRPVCPVSGRFDQYLITRFDDARVALTDPRLSKDLYGPGQHYLRIFGPNSAGLNRNMLNADPPEHTRLRRIVSQAFAPRRIEALRPRVARIVDDLLDKVLPHGRSELMHDFAIPLPMTVICELLGIPPADHGRVLDWTQVIRTSGSSGRSAEEERAAVQDAQLRLHHYLADLVRAKRARPDDDLIGALIAACDDDAALSEAEVVATTFLLLFAGHQTTADFLGNAVLALLTHPEQLELLRTTPQLLPSAIEELLRFDGPLPVASPRIATEDVEYPGGTVPRGAIVGVVINAANHDPAHFADPDRLDIRRVRGPHLGFGHGVHYCLGVSLARMEAQIGLGALLRRLPGLRLAVPAAEVRRLPAASPFRGLLELPVTFAA